MSDNYHTMPGLSSSSARKLLPPSCPARFKWELDNPPPPRAAFDFGHAAHTFVLGEGEQIARLDYDSFRSKAAQTDRDDARSRGLVPLLAADYDKAVAMAKVLRSSPDAAALFTNGQAEVVKHWTDEQTGTPLRTKYDWLPEAGNGPMTVPDYKTAASAAPSKFTKSAFTYGYHIQAAWYVDTVKALGIADDVDFIFAVQEKDPPYLVSLIRLDDVALDIGRYEYRKAIDIYARCMETDTWPGYADAVVTVNTPAWVQSRWLDDIAPDEIEV